MPKSRNQKLKLLYLKDILENETDENNKLTVKQIIEKLEDYGVRAERKSIYDDIDCLLQYGVDVIVEKSDSNYYFIGERNFELPELKLLVDSVQSSKFLTEKKSNSLIKKLESLCSQSQAISLNRQVFISDRIKTMNESIYLTIDEIQNAIQNKEKISFKYLSYSIGNKNIFKRDGKKYIISPYALMLEDQNYYLLGYDTNDKKFKHYRVDKIIGIEATTEPLDGQEEFKEINLPKYSKKFFSMFGGNVEKIKLQVDSDLIGVITDRFGKNIIIKKINDNNFEVIVEIAVSPQFYGWVTSFSGKIKIISPENTVTDFKNHLKKVAAFYK